MIDIISRIFCIVIAALPSVAVVALCISLYKDMHNFHTELKQQSINRIKKELYKEVFSTINDKLSTCDIITDGEYRGYECVDVENMLILLEGKYEIYGEQEIRVNENT